MRAFLAIPVLPPALAGFHALRERLVADITTVHWAPADSPHITLHFFGTVTAAEAQQAVLVLRPVAAAHSSMTLRLAGLGSFPVPRRPRVLWWGVAGDAAALTALASACTAALCAAGFPVTDRPYRPHCTLGRSRQPWPAAALNAWQGAAAESPATASFVADRAILYESVGASTGVRHVPRVTLPLR